MNKWTTEKPTKPGYYWAKFDDNDEPAIVRVSKMFTVSHCGNEQEFDLSDYVYWLGVLTAPEFPSE